MDHNEFNTGLSNEMLNEYMNVSSQDTPDLWSRIDVGFDRELAMMRNEQAQNSTIIQFQRKRTVRRIIISIAALIVICLIALPVINRKSAIKSEEHNKTDSGTKIELVPESSREDVAETDSACCEDTQASFEGDAADNHVPEAAGGQSIDSGNEDTQRVFDDFRVSGYVCMDIAGAVYIYVQDVISQETSAINLSDGNLILLVDSDMVIAEYIKRLEESDCLPDGLLLDAVACYGPFELSVTVEQGNPNLAQEADYTGVLHMTQSISK
ncbi:MAG: hypothetical protein Q4D54_00725 [Eubacteriales bacterium]|nr:hypothetical protein [Lachnospiraceae bacterium]MDO5126255.1 hypothetical protein [Eubacteriales bacterium]